eukprot:CAMPEP_0197180342 /NCGR_PEP_ID=MMETSP1423-20130617/4988_1 /TAXON_ID=476441 /ORGANISM="Pseudo-nitzschia heimii, Strain UNC1101" /LENGTH=362 /DNA_ID=CAMNT_0042630411 /DNA_START=324 /DNA_END=1412 /DNA_ORIENTATION=-
MLVSSAWVVSPPTNRAGLHPFPSVSRPLLHREVTHRRRRSEMFGTKDSQDSSATSTATAPKFPSILNRADTITDKSKDDIVQTVPATRQKKITSKLSNRDIYIENFSSADSDIDLGRFLPLVVTIAATAGVALFTSNTEEYFADTAVIGSFVGSIKDVMTDPSAALERVVELTDSMGTLGIAYFGVAYCIAEILAVPAIPLTASAGYLFGPLKGTAIVLFSASIAAGVSFQIGRTLLRDYVENQLQNYPKFAKIDKAIGKEGFKLMFLLRLSPIFPFALSNYLYGASSINFPAFFFGTLLGFAPGTLAYVYTGYVGKALTDDTISNVYPWYVYLGGLTFFAGILKVVADTATRVVDELEAEE